MFGCFSLDFAVSPNTTGIDLLDTAMLLVELGMVFEGLVLFIILLFWAFCCACTGSVRFMRLDSIKLESSLSSTMSAFWTVLVTHPFLNAFFFLLLIFSLRFTSFGRGDFLWYGEILLTLAECSMLPYCCWWNYFLFGNVGNVAVYNLPFLAFTFFEGGLSDLAVAVTVFLAYLLAIKFFDGILCTFTNFYCYYYSVSPRITADEI